MESNSSVLPNNTAPKASHEPKSMEELFLFVQNGLVQKRNLEHKELMEAALEDCKTFFWSGKYSAFKPFKRREVEEAIAAEHLDRSSSVVGNSVSPDNIVDVLSTPEATPAPVGNDSSQRTVSPNMWKYGPGVPLSEILSVTAPAPVFHNPGFLLPLQSVRVQPPQPFQPNPPYDPRHPELEKSEVRRMMKWNQQIEKFGPVGNGPLGPSIEYMEYSVRKEQENTKHYQKVAANWEVLTYERDKVWKEHCKYLNGVIESMKSQPAAAQNANAEGAKGQRDGEREQRGGPDQVKKDSSFSIATAAIPSSPPLAQQDPSPAPSHFSLSSSSHASPFNSPYPPLCPLPPFSNLFPNLHSTSSPHFQLFPFSFQPSNNLLSIPPAPRPLSPFSAQISFLNPNLRTSHQEKWAEAMKRFHESPVYKDPKIHLYNCLFSPSRCRRLPQAVKQPMGSYYLYRCWRAKETENTCAVSIEEIAQDWKAMKRAKTLEYFQWKTRGEDVDEEHKYQLSIGLICVKSKKSYQ